MSGTLAHALEIAVVVLVGAAAIVVVRTRDPERQAIAVSFYGVLVAVMFLVYRAPDVALSQLVIGAVALPLLVLLALTRIRENDEQREQTAHPPGEEERE